MNSILATQNGSTSGCLDFESLKTRCLGRVDLVQRLLEKFNSTVDGDISLLEQAVTVRDWPRAASLAHRIRGSSLSVSAIPLAECSYEVERSALTMASVDAPQRDDDCLMLEVLIAELRMEYQAVCDASDAIAKGANRGQ